MANGNGYGLILNGLKGAELIVFNLLYLNGHRDDLSAGRIAHLTTYHPNTIQNALASLEQLGLIERRRDKNGQPYTCRVKDNNKQ